MKGMTVKSVKKKWNSKGFAAGVNRDLIDRGIEMIGMDKDEVISLAIEALANVEKEIGL
jgi:predicted hydrolase (HD superfamily)